MARNRLQIHEYSLSERQKLWSSFRNGDIRAYEQLFNLFYEDLYAYGLKLSARPELVRDGIQSLFVTIWDRKEHLGEVRSAKAYLLASLRRSLLKIIREERNRNAPESVDELQGEAVQISVEESIILKELKDSQIQALKKALENLPEKQKEVLFLKYYHGMSYDEIEEILSINYQSIRNHIYRALQNLREHFNEKEDFIDIILPLLPVLWFIF